MMCCGGVTPLRIRLKRVSPVWILMMFRMLCCIVILGIYCGEWVMHNKDHSKSTIENMKHGSSTTNNVKVSFAVLTGCVDCLQVVLLWWERSLRKIYFFVNTVGLLGIWVGFVIYFDVASKKTPVRATAWIMPVITLVVSILIACWSAMNCICHRRYPQGNFGKVFGTFSNSEYYNGGETSTNAPSIPAQMSQNSTSVMSQYQATQPQMAQSQFNQQQQSQYPGFPYVGNQAIDSQNQGWQTQPSYAVNNLMTSSYQATNTNPMGTNGFNTDNYNRNQFGRPSYVDYAQGDVSQRVGAASSYYMQGDNPFKDPESMYSSQAQQQRQSVIGTGAVNPGLGTVRRPPRPTYAPNDFPGRQPSCYVAPGF